MCVQRFDDSQSSAIRITYRISLRSSSFQEPRYPSWIVIKNSLIHTKLQHSQLTQVSSLSLASPTIKTLSNDPSAGSPTETLLRLHLPLNGKIYTTSLNNHQSVKTDITKIQSVHRTIQSVGATGGVYKGQGRNQRKLMTCIY